jgi:hypothetical protein
MVSAARVEAVLRGQGAGVHALGLLLVLLASAAQAQSAPDPPVPQVVGAPPATAALYLTPITPPCRFCTPVPPVEVPPCGPTGGIPCRPLPPKRVSLPPLPGMRSKPEPLELVPALIGGTVGGVIGLVWAKHPLYGAVGALAGAVVGDLVYRIHRCGINLCIEIPGPPPRPSFSHAELPEYPPEHVFGANHPE